MFKVLRNGLLRYILWKCEGRQCLALATNKRRFARGQPSETWLFGLDTLVILGSRLALKLVARTSFRAYPGMSHGVCDEEEGKPSKLGRVESVEVRAVRADQTFNSSSVWCLVFEGKLDGVVWQKDRNH